MLKYIFLDFYGTVVEEDDVYIQEIAETIRKNSVLKCETNKISQYWYSAFQEICSRSTENEFLNQKQIEIESLRMVTKKFDSKSDENELARILFDYWRNPVLFEDARIFLQKTKIPVCIVSNIDTDEIENAIKNTGIDVEKVITSEKTKSYKPHRKIFEDALRECNCGADEVIHIGDSYSSDIKGSHSLGIKNIWMNRNGRKTIEQRHNYNIGSFDELANILDEEG